VVDIINFDFQIHIIANNPIEVFFFPETAASVKNPVDLERSTTLEYADYFLKEMALKIVRFRQRLNQEMAMVGHNHVSVDNERFLVPG